MTEQSTTPVQPEQANLSVQDIFGATNIIKAAIERGKCFTAEEMGEVSGLYGKLLAFCQFVSAQAEAQSKAAAEQAAAATPTPAPVEAPVAPAPVLEAKKTKKSKK
jgi:hypothetical protein